MEMLDVIEEEAEMELKAMVEEYQKGEEALIDGLNVELAKERAEEYQYKMNWKCHYPAEYVDFLELLDSMKPRSKSSPEILFGNSDRMRERSGKQNTMLCKHSLNHCIPRITCTQATTVFTGFYSPDW